MFKACITSLAALLLLAGCAQPPEESVSPEPSPAPAETKEATPPETEVTEPANPEPAPVQELTNENLSVFQSLDDVCGTTLFDGSLISGTGSDASANASMIGMSDDDTGKLECILSETDSHLTVADFKAGVDPIQAWSSGSDTWGARGSIVPLGDSILLTLNLYWIPSRD